MPSPRGFSSPLSPAHASTYTWTDGSGDGLWNTTSLNWTGSAWSGSSTDSATFGGSGVGTVNVVGTQDVNNVTVSAAGYGFTGDTLNLSGSMTLNSAVGTLTCTLAGAGTLVDAATGTTYFGLSSGVSSNSYSGGTVMEAGTLRIYSDADLGASSGPVTFAGNSAIAAYLNPLTLNPSRTITINPSVSASLTTANNVTFTVQGNITGSGSLVANAGAGSHNVIILSGDNTYTGATTVRSGTLQIGNGSSGEALASPGISVGSGATLVFNHADALTYSGSVSGGGAPVKTGSGTLTLAGNTSQTGGLAVNGGVLAFNTAQSYSGATVISSGTLALNTAPASLPVIAGLAYRLDASNGSSVTLSGNTVTAWNDLANQVNFTTCSNYATLPTYVTGSNGINGLSAVSFTGSNGSAGTGNNLLANQAVTADGVHRLPAQRLAAQFGRHLGPGGRRGQRHPRRRGRRGLAKRNGQHLRRWRFHRLGRLDVP